jgi:hypothetical protein
MRRLADKLTYANVISTICLFLLLGGGAAFAASNIHLGKNAVGVNQLKKNSVTNAKIKKDAVTGGKVKNGSLSGSDIDQASLNAVRAANVTAIAVLGDGTCSPAVPFPTGVTTEHTAKGSCKVNFPTSQANCSANATVHHRLGANELIIAGERTAQITSGVASPNTLAVSTRFEGNASDLPFDLVVVC